MNPVRPVADPDLYVRNTARRRAQKQNTPPAEKEKLPGTPPEASYIKPSRKKLDVINKARNIIRGERTLDSKELAEHIKELIDLDQFAYATEVLLIKMKQDKSSGLTIRPKDHQTLAKFIYKDHSLPSSFKFRKALEEISGHEDLTTTETCETLGLTGAIYKRKWQFDHQFQNLILARYYYKRGFEKWKEFIDDFNNPKPDGKKDDDGYNAINYAYINELMAVDKMEVHGSVTGFTESIQDLFNVAKDTREFIIKQFTDENDPEKLKQPEENYQSWVIATLAEAYFGLRNYKKAFLFIRKYIAREKPRPWEIRSFSQQMFSLAYLQNYCKGFAVKYKTGLPFKEKLEDIAANIEAKEIDRCLYLFKHPENVEETDAPSAIPIETAAEEVKKEGKLGLALSGGGFRSALFHIGVLAALAEKDELKNVEVISCVSGGSIIGAFYYLKLKKLLEEKSDEKVGPDSNYIMREDYIRIVKEIEEEFLKGVQKNLRMRIFSDLLSNFRMFSKHYSRTHRLGELYEKYLFKDLITISRTQEDKDNGKKDNEIYMSDLFIKPKGAPADFRLDIDNWKRKNKVPQLILNATSVNTGHNWQFTASWMGEPPGNIQPDVDVKPRLRRMYYQEAPSRYKNFRLGYAVGASSCVPVMFQPMPLPDLYPDIELQLIDGGVNDNQGIGALIEQECKNMIISDGSGQMSTNTIATKSHLSLFFRSDIILQERLRELQFLDIKQRNSTTQINSLLTVHLKSDLENRPVSWKFCTDPPRTIMYSNVANTDTDLTRYGVLRNVQLLLSQIRTDLDSFHDTEAYALMYSGYAQIKCEHKRQRKESNATGNPEQEASSVNWKFLQIKDYLTNPATAMKKEKLLKEASRVPFKLYHLSMALKVVTIILGALALCGLIYVAFFDRLGSYSIINVTVNVIVVTLILFLVGMISKALATIINIRTVIRKNLAFLAVLLVSFLISNFYLIFFNGLYNTYGEIEESK